MSRLPNPFLSGQGNQQRTPQRPPTPGFLMMTRPPIGSNQFGGAHYQSPSTQSENFIPFSNIVGNSSDNRQGNSQGHGRYNFNRNNGGGRHGNNSPRFAHPYQQSPGGRMPSPRSHHGQGHSHGFNNTPGGRYNSNSSGMNYSTPRGNFSATPGGRFNSGGGGRRDNFRDHRNRSFNDFNTPDPNGNSKGGWDRSRGRGPISNIPIDKFISDNMVGDPWAEFHDGSSHGGQVEQLNQSDSGCLEDLEIIIDSDTSARVENSFDDVVSDTEVDSSPVHDTGSDSPNIATSSTSEKDTGSDTGSDT